MWQWLGILSFLAILILPAYLYDKRRRGLVSSLRRERLTTRDVHMHREKPGRVIYGGTGPGVTGIWTIRSPGSGGAGSDGGFDAGGEGDGGGD